MKNRLSAEDMYNLSIQARTDRLNKEAEEFEKQLDKIFFELEKPLN